MTSLKYPEKLQDNLTSLFESMAAQLSLFRLSCTAASTTNQMSGSDCQKIAHLSQKSDDITMALYAALSSLSPTPVTLSSIDSEFNTLVVDFTANTILLAHKVRQIAVTSDNQEGIKALSQKILEANELISSIADGIQPMVCNTSIVQH